MTDHVDSVPFRAAVTAELDRHRIGWGVHYPIPCHRQPAYREFAESLPVAEQAAEQIISLPMSPTLTDAPVDQVCEVMWLFVIESAPVVGDCPVLRPHCCLRLATRAWTDERSRGTQCRLQ
jgi:hypothetical protein